MKFTKAQGQIGAAILAMAALLLLGGIFIDSDFEENSVDRYQQERENQRQQAGNEYVIDGFLEEDYLFYLNETDIGRQRKVTESFPNIELGAKEEFNTVYLGNNFRLRANPFTSDFERIEVQLSNANDVDELYLYLNPDRNSGDQDLMVFVNGQRVSKNQASGQDLPIKVYLDKESMNISLNNSRVEVVFALEKPEPLDLFNWNSMDVTDLRVVEVVREKENSERAFDFNINKQFLDSVFLDLTIACDEVTDEFGSPIKATINGYIVANNNPNCLSRFNRITSNVSLNILNNGINRLELETDGYYRVAYGITQEQFNDQDIYKFNVNSFNDIIDVVMYGDFDKEVIDIKINNQLFQLERDKVVSIVSHLRFGTNEIEFITKPVEIREFIIEKNEFNY